MGDAITLQAVPRTAMAKHVKHLRADGLTPIVVYGPKAETIALQASTRELVRVLALAGGTQLVAIDVEGEDSPRMTLAKEVQRHVTKLHPIHADFLQVVMDEPITKHVPLRIIGDAPVVRRNEGLLAVAADQILVQALPGNLPAFIELDVSHLEAVGDTVLASTLDAGADVQVLAEADAVIARVEAPRLVEVDEPIVEEGEEGLEEALVEGEAEEEEAEAGGAPGEQPERE